MNRYIARTAGGLLSAATPETARNDNCPLSRVRRACCPGPGEPECRVCGCTWERACPGGCYWVEPDLCSRCAETEAAEGAGI